MGHSTEIRFYEFMKEQDSLREAIALIQWDMRTKIPEKGVQQRAEVIGYLSEKLHRLQTSDKMNQFIQQLKDQTNNAITQKAVRECEQTYNRNQKIPHQEMKEYVMLQNQSEHIWQEARKKADFKLFAPYLEKLVEFNKKFAGYWGYEDNIYDALLNEYEPGVTTKLLDKVFPYLRGELTGLTKRINASQTKPDPAILHGHFPQNDQHMFSMDILTEMGFDFDSGRLDETIHPFAIGINRHDVRVTTRYDENDFRMAVFGTIHEGGHALYEQNIGAKLAGTPLAAGTSMGIHESQSLFWENFVGRNKSFWESHYDLFKKYAPANFKSIALDDFYSAVNEVKPSLIRIEADELTYPLHIMVRYELEKALMNDEIHVRDLPYLWNEKMDDYLGVRPSTDSEGVLQDIHWAGGDFGYFPSYALGFMYAAQFEHAMRKELNLDKLLKCGDLTPIRKWLTNHVHQYGKTKRPLEIVRDITNEDLNPEYLISYLTNKYTNIYHL